jgi:hypothetical protein
MEAPHMRRCDGCTMCCKLMLIHELEKPEGVWCKYCDIGIGCQIYEQRPAECRSFRCGFLQLGTLSEDWRPSKCKIVLAPALDGKRLGVYVDPARPDIWKSEPFYSQLKQWALETISANRQVIVYVARRAIVILPNKDVDLGEVGPDEHIITTGHRGLSGIEYDAIKMKPDDPRLSYLSE